MIASPRAAAAWEVAGLQITDLGGDIPLSKFGERDGGLNIGRMALD